MSPAIHREFQDIAGQISPDLRTAIRQSGAVRLRPRPDRTLPEVLCRIIVGQQLSVKAASTIWARVVKSTEGRPLLEHLATARADLLRNCGMSRSKAKAMKAIVQAEADGILETSHLREMSHALRSHQLTQIWGVGQWTADIVSISYFGDPDVWPDSDVTVWKTLERLTSRRRKTLRTAAYFAPRRSYLALYMWKIADTKPTK